MVGKVDKETQVLATAAVVTALDSLLNTAMKEKGDTLEVIVIQGGWKVSATRKPLEGYRLFLRMA